MPETASAILDALPTDSMRAIFLYVGQGESTLFLVPNGGDVHLSMLVDCNRGVGLNGIDIPRLLADVLPKKEKRGDTELPVLDVFVNTHPHSDHIGGLKELRESVIVKNVWHSGHKPGPDHDGPYSELEALMKEVEKAKGNVVQMKGSRSSMPFGRAEIHVVSPAKYVVDDVEGEKPEDRYKRIHEQCAVMRVAYGDDKQKARILITGDSDKTAWKEHITEYHSGGDDQKDTASRIAAEIFSAPHHGSYTFFKDHKDDESPYEEHLPQIAPKQVIISAPDQDDSKHGHPDDWALGKYKDAVGDDGICHMGSEGNSFVVDVAANGTYDIGSDDGALANAYGLGKDDDDGGNGGGGSKQAKSASIITSRIEKSRPMGKR